MFSQHTPYLALPSIITTKQSVYNPAHNLIKGKSKPFI